MYACLQVFLNGEFLECLVPAFDACMDGTKSPNKLLGRTEHIPKQ